MERNSLFNRKITLVLTVLSILSFFHLAAIQNNVWAKTCWVSGQDSCRSNCQQQFNYACDDGSNYSEVKNCCGSSGGGSTQTAPGVPTGVDYNCTYTGNQVTIQWSAVSGASKYALRVQRDGQALPACNGQQAANYGGVCNDNVTGTSFTMNVDPDASYGYWLHAVNSAGWSGAVSGPTKIRCAPNCSNVSGPNGLLTNQTGSYSANVESLDGDLTGQLFVNNFSAMGSYNRLPGYSGTTTYDWKPTSAGSYQMNCRAWNDSRVECRAAGVPRVNGSGVVNPPEQRQCVGPNTTKTVQVFNPASVTILSNSASGDITFRSSWGDSRPSRSVNLAKCTDSTCRTLESSFNCPSGVSISGSSKSSSGGWCRYEMSDSSKTKDWTINSYTSGLTPGNYVFAINQVAGGVGCSGNPICTMNGGSVNCGSSWISCGGSDYVTFAALPKPMPRIDVVDTSVAGNLLTNNQRTDGQCDYGQWCKWSRNGTSTTEVLSNGDLRLTSKTSNQEYGSCWIQWVQNAKADGSYYRLRANLSSNFPSTSSFFQFEMQGTDNYLNPPIYTGGKTSVDWVGPINKSNLPISLKFCTWGTGTVNAQAVLQSVSFVKDPVAGCKPTQISPINNAVVAGIPTLKWNSCSGVSYYKVQVNGGGIAWTSLPLTSTSYTMNGFTFRPGSTYTWSVQACGDGSCKNAGTWTSNQTFRSPAADLTVAGAIAVSPASALVGQSVNVKFTVKNQGNASGSGVYSYTNQSGGTSSIASDNTCTGSTVLAPGATCISSYNFTFPTSGAKKMEIFVDPQNKVAESNENNNKFTQTINVAPYYTRVSLNEVDAVPSTHNAPTIAAYKLNTNTKVVDCVPDASISGRKAFKCNGVVQGTDYTYKAIATAKTAGLPTITSQINGKASSATIFDLWVTYANKAVISPSKPTSAQSSTLTISGKKLRSPVARLTVVGGSTALGALNQTFELPVNSTTFSKTFNIPPLPAGTYKVKISVAEGYKATIPASVLTYDSFTFTVTQEITPTVKPPTPAPTTSYTCKTDADCAYCGANCITKGTQLTCSRIAVVGSACICVTGRCTSVAHTPTPKPPTPTNTVAASTPTPTVQPATATAVPPTNTSAPLPTVDECPNFVLGNATCDADGVINNEDYICWKNQYLTKLQGGTPGAIGNCKRVANFDSSTDGVGLLDFAIWRVNALRQSSQ